MIKNRTMRDSKFATIDKFVNLRPTKYTQLAANMNERKFDSNGRPHPKSLDKFIEKKTENVFFLSSNFREKAVYWYIKKHN